MFAEVVFNDFREVASVVADWDYTCKKIVNRTADDISDWKNEEYYRTEFDTEDNADDRTYTCDIQKLNEHIFPMR